MVAVYSRVIAEISPHLKENFPDYFDFSGMLQKICQDAGVTVSLVDEIYHLEGLSFDTISRAHNMLVSTLAVFGSSSSIREEQEGMISQAQGSLPFSALVEAAEAISRGVELQEQVQHDMMRMGKLAQLSEITRMANENISPVSTDVSARCSKENIAIIDEYLATRLHNGNDMAYHVETANASSSEIKSELSKPNKSSDEESTHMKLPVDQKDVFTDGDDECSQEECIEDERDDDVEWKIQSSDETCDDGYDADHGHIRTKNLGKKEAKAQQKELNDHDLDEAKVQRVTIIKSSSKKEDLAFSDNGEEQQKTVRQSRRFKDDEGNSVFPCDECDYTGKSRSNLGDHKHRVHFAKPTQCDICEKVFPNIRYMKRHRASHSKPQHFCDICGKQYKVLKAMKDHRKRHDKNYVKPEWKCTQCPKSFCSSYILECHVKSEHMGMKKSFLCQTCGKSFTTKHTLLQHYNVHIGARPYQCEDCGKSFSYESALRDHKYIHEGTKKFVCTYPSCKKAFRQRSALKMHEKIHNESKDFTCSECDRGFTQKQALQRHLRAHKGLKPFICKICCRTFGDASIIRRHMILVHKIHKDPANWREDIITNGKSSDDLHDKKSEEQGNSIETEQLEQTSNVANIAQEHVFTVVSASDSAATRLPPVAALHSFRASLENYSTNDMASSEPALIHSQDETGAAQYSLSLPHHHDYAIQTMAASEHYQYTVQALEPPPAAGDMKDDTAIEKPLGLQHHSGIQHVDNVKSIPMEPAIPEKQPVQYVEDTAFTNIIENKVRKTHEVPTKSTQDLSNVAANNSNETLIVNDLMAGSLKEATDMKPAEVEVADSVSISQLFAYYSSLASQYMNVGQYASPSVVSQSDNMSANNQLPQ